MKLLVWEADALQRVQAAGQGSPVSAHRRLGFREAPGLIFCSLIVLKLEAFDEDGFFFSFSIHEDFFMRKYKSCHSEGWEISE